MIKTWMMIFIAINLSESEPRTVEVIAEIATKTDCLALGQQYRERFPDRETTLHCIEMGNRNVRD